MRYTLAAAFPAAWRAADQLMNEHPTLDSIALDVLAPLATESVDGWAGWRTSWPGRVTVRVPGGEIDTGASTTRLGLASATVDGGPSDDVVAAAIALHGAAIGVRMQTGATVPPVLDADTPPPVRIMRTATGGERESASPASSPPIGSSPSTPAARSASSVASRAVPPSRLPVRIEWPIDGHPRGWVARHDSAGAIAARGVALVAMWSRTAAPPGDDAARAIAWWSDGMPAATERVADGECVKAVGIVVPHGSDLLLAAQAQALLAAIVAPCGAGFAPIPASILDTTTTTPLASVSALARTAGVGRIATRGTLPAILLAAAIALLLVEWIIRSRGGGEKAGRGGAAGAAPPHERAA